LTLYIGEKQESWAVPDAVQIKAVNPTVAKATADAVRAAVTA
jgi:hypothetical protein